MTPPKRVRATLNPPKKRKLYRYKLMQNGIQVAMVEAPNKDEAFGEIQHYAMIYGQDGPVKIVEVKPKKRKVQPSEIMGRVCVCGHIESRHFKSVYVDRKSCIIARPYELASRCSCRRFRPKKKPCGKQRGRGK